MSAIPDTIRFCYREAVLRLRDGRLLIRGKDATHWDASHIESAACDHISRVGCNWESLALDGVTKIERFVIVSKSDRYYVRRLWCRRADPSDPHKFGVFGSPGSVWFDVEAVQSYDHDFLPLEF